VTIRRRWRIGLRLWIIVGCTLSLSACPALAQTPQAAARGAATDTGAAEAAAISTVVQQYYAALNQRDIETALHLWSDRSPELVDITRLLPQTLERTQPVWSEITSTLMSVSGDTARARVGYLVSYSYTGRPPSTPYPNRNVMTFIRDAAGWRIHGEKPETQDVAERLMAATDDAALEKIVREEGEAITLTTVRFLIGLAGHAFASQQHDAAIRGFERAVRFSETPVGPLTDMELKNDMAAMSLGQALGGLAQVHIYKPRPDLTRGIELLTRALTLHERVKNDGGMSDALQALGNAYYSLGDYARALDAYQRVLPIAEKMQDRDTIARTHQGIGNAQYLFGQFDRALAAYTAALDGFVAQGKLGSKTVDDQARALQGLGRVFAAVGDFDRGRVEFGRALALLEGNPGSQKTQQASVLIELGRMDFQQGILDGAKTLYTRALTVAETAGDPFTQGRALFSLGLVSVVQSAFDEAVQLYTRAATAFQGIPNADAVGQAWLARASARFEQRDHQRALEDFTLSLKTFEGTKNQEGLARAYLGLAMSHEQLNAPPQALEYAARAYEYAISSVTPDVQWQARHVTGGAWLRSGDRVKARQAFEEAIAMLEASRLDLAGGEESLAPTERAASYVALVEWHVANGAAADALIVADAEKRRLLEDLLRPFRFRLTRGLSVERQTDERRLLNRRVSLLKQIRRERENAAASSATGATAAAAGARVVALEKELTAVRTEAGEWQQAVARDLPSLVYQRGEAKFTSLDALAAALPADAAFIHFVVGDDRTSAIVATHPRAAGGDSAAGTDGGDEVANANRQAAPRLDLRAFTVDVTRQQLVEQVWRYTDGIAKKADTVMADGRALYELLLAPAADRIAGRTTLVIVPDDALWTLPFEALTRADGRYLIEDTAITLLPSASAWLSRPAPAVESALAEPPLTAIDTTGEVSDIVPLQTRLTFPIDDMPPLRPGTEPASAGGPLAATPGAAAAAADAQPPAPTASKTLAAWELFERDLTTHDLVLAGVVPKGERLRLDAGRLGPTGLYWAAQVAGARRVIFSRRSAPPAAPAAPAAPSIAASGLPHPHDWATWLVIGPPLTPFQPPQAQP
jgi:tetratricopeptide (TPR) repeat protein